eukprot:CAMPEP_0169119790 /NCGR_PEP_ID=MMETSP1015-20121227/31752_1 /TAXON_ID=342587 /ORGANISM="Karlodinium micrum, Strain CCMP2283" /LENGTH=94 /DNA_ID=CAMNT_0009182709 /DNA_START=210 /DNA_END=491 /DNA_ORIENTATION=-
MKLAFLCDKPPGSLPDEAMSEQTFHKKSLSIRPPTIIGTDTYVLTPLYTLTPRRADFVQNRSFFADDAIEWLLLPVLASPSFANQDPIAACPLW